MSGRSPTARERGRFHGGAVEAGAFGAGGFALRALLTQKAEIRIQKSDSALPPSSPPSPKQNPKARSRHLSSPLSPLTSKKAGPPTCFLILNH